ncbi:MAG: SDR family oxidoreductase [Pseudomonadota bacterium]
MKNKTCVITGANSGIGLETARGLAHRGARVVLVCRDRSKGEAARRELIAATGNGQISLLVADLASLDQVRRLAGEIQAGCPRLDLLIHNAGLMCRERQVSADGFELHLAVHHLAPFLLTHLLLDLLRRSAPARVILVSSRLHRLARIDFDDLQCKRSYGMLRAYGQSKLAMLHFGYELAERLRGSGVTVNALHPGTVATNIGIPGWLSPFIATPEKGARTSIHLACAPELEQVTGRYFANGKEARSSRRSHDRAVGRRLWAVTEKLCGIAGPAA